MLQIVLSGDEQIKLENVANILSGAEWFYKENVVNSLSGV